MVTRTVRTQSTTVASTIATGIVVAVNTDDSTLIVAAVVTVPTPDKPTTLTMAKGIVGYGGIQWCKHRKVSGNATVITRRQVQESSVCAIRYL